MIPVHWENPYNLPQEVQDKLRADFSDMYKVNLTPTGVNSYLQKKQMSSSYNQYDMNLHRFSKAYFLTYVLDNHSWQKFNQIFGENCEQMRLNPKHWKNLKTPREINRRMNEYNDDFDAESDCFEGGDFQSSPL